MTPAEDADVLRSVTGAARIELDRIRGSRFVAVAAPVRGEGAAQAMVEAERARHPDASHHCWAFVLADGRRRRSDDGEPRDTAGAPILRHLEGSGLVDVVVVVTRWFGGTKLGRGGLVRAYGDAAAAALAACEVTLRERTARFTLAHPYELTNAVDAVIAAHDAHEVDAVYGARVERTVEVPTRRAGSFGSAITEASGGRVRARPTDTDAT